MSSTYNNNWVPPEALVAQQWVVRRHKRENELSRRRDERAFPLVERLKPGENTVNAREFGFLVQFFFYESQPLAKRALREGRFVFPGAEALIVVRESNDRG